MSLSVARPTVEYADRPLGIDVAAPRFGWALVGEGYQAAYQIQVGATSGGAQVWDSGRVATAASLGVAYTGPPLQPRTRYHWRARVWDGAGGVSAWSAPSWFETALGIGEAWPASWIGAPPGLAGPAPLLRREFTLSAPVSRARLYVCGLGYHEVWLNGRRSGDALFEPALSDWDSTVYYATHDVTGLLTQGANAVGVELGRGFHALTTPNVWGWHTAPWHNEPRLLAWLAIDHPDGGMTSVASDASWRVAAGPTLFDSLYAGETYDARRAPAGWNRAGLDDSTEDSGWALAVVRDGPRGRLRAQTHDPIRVLARIPPVGVTRPVGSPPGEWVADLGRTIAGRSRLRLAAAPPGTTVTLTHGETLAPDGTVAAVNQNVPGRCQRDVYVAAGGGSEQWAARFSYKGFRYVQVEGVAPEATTVTGELVASDVADAASFDCSHEPFTALEAAMRRTVRNNLHGVPTDTPMYEKNGWTGDVHVAVETLAVMFDLSRLLPKWLHDLRDAQAPSGQLPVIAPTPGWGYTQLAPSPEWTTVYPTLLRGLHRWYGDRGAIAEHWPSLVSYLDWELNRLSDGLASTALGDWLAPGYDGVPPEDTRLTATAYLCRALRQAAECAELLGEDPAVPQRYRAAAAGLRNALNRTFLDPARGCYVTAADPGYRQTNNLVPLAFGLAPDALVGPVVNSLVRDIEKRGGHLNTGCLGTQLLLPTLTEHGHAELAYRVAAQTDYPSWGEWLAHGADTMYEAWGLRPRSRDHYFLGTVVQWLYQHVAGLRVHDDGWQRFVVRPDARHGLTHARLRVETVRGPVATEWSTSDSESRITVEVPAGCTAEVHVPTDAGWRVHTVGPGVWHWG